jgi:hypothetical protein
MKHKLLSHFPLLRAALLLPLVAGCVVPQTRYEEARSAISVEQEAHRRTLEELASISNKLAAAEQAVAERERRLEERDQKISEAHFSASVAEQDKSTATDLVEQLRGELARVGDHLKAFSDEKQRLADALGVAQQRNERLAEAERTVAARAALVRDLSILLHQPISLGSIELGSRDGRVELLIPKDELGEKPGAAATQAFAALVRVAQLKTSLRFELADATALAAPEPAPTSDDSTAKAPTTEGPGAATPSPPLASRVQAELVSRGIAADRLKIGAAVPATSVDGVVVYFDG